MLTQIGLYLILLAVIIPDIVKSRSVTSTSVEHSDKKRDAADFFELSGTDPNRSYDNHDVDQETMLYKKRQVKKKWLKPFQQSQSPYTIAFPALIRTRRWIEQED